MRNKKNIIKKIVSTGLIVTSVAGLFTAGFNVALRSLGMPENSREEIIYDNNKIEVLGDIGDENETKEKINDVISDINCESKEPEGEQQDKITEEIKEAEKTEEMEKIEKEVYVTAKSGLNIRTENSTAGNVIATVPYRTKLSVTGICKNSWLRIYYKEKVLYVCGKYTSDTEPAERTVTDTPKESNTNDSKNTPVSQTSSNWNYKRTGLEVNINKYKENGIVYWVANIYTDNPERDINTAFSGGSYKASINSKKKTSTLAKENNAILAINGDACGFRGVGSPYQDPCLIRNGKGEYELIKGKNIGEMCGLTKGGELLIFNPINYSSNQELINMGITDTWWFDCALVKEGQIPQSLIDVESSLSRAPYTAIGQKDSHNFLFIVVDGRGSNGSSGVTYTGMARLMQKYGACTAYQLDGGGSSTIWFNGNVLNKPSDGSERAISDIVYVRK